MSGLVKPTKINFEDSNLALFGTDVEKKLKQSAAEHEKAWEGAGLSEGVRVWRIEKFQVKAWPEERKGEFYRGDAYIVLHTYKKADTPDKLIHEIFFWIGAEASQDEYGTAAYKTVELDDHLHGDAAQHREVDSSESATFLALFKKFRVLSGGIESGFKHVGPEKYETRLLHLRGTLRGGIVVRDSDVTVQSLNSSDVFILDQGLTLYLFVGKYSNPAEKMKGQVTAEEIQNERGSHRPNIIRVDEDDNSDDAKAFWNALGGRKPIDRKVPDPAPYKAKLYQVSDKKTLVGSNGTLSIAEVAVHKDSLNHTDVFLLDKGDQLFVWIGKDASKEEKSKGGDFGLKYLYDHNHPNKRLTVSRIVDGNEPNDFWAALK